MVLTETKIPMASYCPNRLGYNIFCLSARPASAGEVQGGVGLVLRDRPMGCSLEMALPQAKSGKLQGRHRYVPDSDIWSIPPAVNTFPHPQYRGGPGALPGSRPHCVGRSQLGPG